MTVGEFHKEAFQQKTFAQPLKALHFKNLIEWHYDLEEIFVIQSLGEKEFYLRPNTVKAYPLPAVLPKNLEFEKGNTQTEMRCFLKPGARPYIPSGWWHMTKAQGPSFHVSIGVLKPAQRNKAVTAQN